ncbi:hypothetical protein BZL29_4238 [Mycobacterium kansasii]|uniref:Uncharacterized protein n=1 Tax=Mycobacterium kansasii TaxID=1768 RepID=A0A1V3X668_MYCKA|nr:hypothetical protein BZL29_4238 [Mycobacterium kansasii]
MLNAGIGDTAAAKAVSIHSTPEDVTSRCSRLPARETANPRHELPMKPDSRNQYRPTPR